jgi:3-oxoacyl-[acyl-carrier-protein] synthase-3
MEESMEICLKKANILPSDIRWFVPHQANQRIIESAAKRFGIPEENTVITIDRFANTSAATIPIALDLLLQEDQIKSGDYLLLAAVGGGLTWGATVLQAT